MKILDKLKGFNDINKGYTQIQKFSRIKGIFFTDTHKYDVIFTVSKDRTRIVPIGINRIYKLDKIYIDEKTKEPYVIIYDNSIKSVDFSDRPIKEKITRAVERIDKDKDNNVIRTIDLKEYEITGSKDLSSTGFMFAKTGFLKYMEEPSKKEQLFIFIIALLIGLFGGFIIAVILK